MVTEGVFPLERERYCPEWLTMEQVMEIAENGEIKFDGLRFESSSMKNVRDILPSSWSPTAYTAQANLRSLEIDGQIITCVYGYKTAASNALSKMQFWREKEELDEELDYRFALFYDRTPEIMPIIKHYKKTTTNEDDVSSKDVVEIIRPKKVLTQEDVQKDNILKKSLEVLDLANNRKISWRIVTIQYNLMKFWKSGAELDRIHTAFSELEAYFVT